MLICEKSTKELYEMDNSKLQQRLYVISRFESDGRIQLLKTINAEKDPFTENIKDFNKMPEKIRQSINKLNYLIKGKDFDLVNGEIIFLNKK